MPRYRPVIGVTFVCVVCLAAFVLVAVNSKYRQAGMLLIIVGWALPLTWAHFSR